jgi:glyoxylase-like metal-dependent hydrolase (beta-lactamase superfamily II)
MAEPELDWIDLRFRDLPQVIATAVLTGPEGVALVDPGPASTWPVLTAALAERGVAPGDVRAVLLTHIHLDHAGASGRVARELPGATIYVHARGAPHLVDPSRLLQSAARLYGEDLERLWGEVAPVPAAQVRALVGGERLTIAGRRLEVADTPGHASHHVSYFDAATGIVFAGDTAGIRRGSGRYLLPPTPPPDIDLERWRESLGRLQAWAPAALFVTHFGLWRDAGAHLEAFRARLDQWAERARALLAREDLDDAARMAAFVRAAEAEMEALLPEPERPLYQQAGRVDYSWLGLARYWRKRVATARP